jgi:aerobic-type carbon monoxide dehydrogenase small subunit (CoxS/CutS family)
MADTVTIEFTLNHSPCRIEAPGGLTLLALLRDYLHLTGTKCGCEIGECGACTVIFNGKAVTSCLVLAAQANGGEVETVEGLTREFAPDGSGLHPLQKAFLDKDAVACGYCTPGMLMSAKALLDQNPTPSRDEIKKAISGNLCRCTGYIPIIDAIEAAAAEIASHDSN